MKAKSKILIAIPSLGFDPSEAAIPWQYLTKQYEVQFATPDGLKGAADAVMLSGKGLGIWKASLQASKDAKQAYQAMEKDELFNNPIAYDEIEPNDFLAILLPGGHDKSIKPYLESKVLQQKIVNFFSLNKPVAAVCHGVLLVARSIDPKTEQSILYQRKTTGLLRKQERLAYHLTRWWKGDYFLTYPATNVEDEVKSLLENYDQFVKGPQPLFRDNENNTKRGFCLRDGNYLSARWPGDIHCFSQAFLQLLEQQSN
ncbi:MAG: type 1 glutamine amidotransferase domain-containing protein [Enterobacterales bacterium]|nr:type 1 glutamine amidotransferase domain-containing protein [Enterobacterales bacterium]